MSFYRSLSPIERSYLYYDTQNAPPTTMIFALEGTGHFDPTNWQSAIEHVVAANPGFRLKKKGALKFSYWDDEGRLPQLILRHNCQWDGNGPNLPDFLTAPMNSEEGPLTQVILCDSHRAPLKRVIIRTHHAVTDGQGNLHFTRELFRALRGESLLGTQSTVRDLDIGKFVSAPRQNMVSRNSPGLTQATASTDQSLYWHRYFIPGRYSKALAKIAFCLHKASEHIGDQALRIRITTDLRRYTNNYHPSNFTSANASGAMDIMVENQDTPDSIYLKIQQALEDKQDVRMPSNLFIEFAQWTPISFSGISEPLALKYLKGNRFVRSATLSNMGRVDHKEFSYADFECTSTVSIPLTFRSNGLFLVMMGSDDGITLSAGLPKVLAEEQQLEVLMDRFLGIFSQFKTAPNPSNASANNDQGTDSSAEAECATP